MPTFSLCSYPWSWWQLFCSSGPRTLWYPCGQYLTRRAFHRGSRLCPQCSPSPRASSTRSSTSRSTRRSGTGRSVCCARPVTTRWLMSRPLPCALVGEYRNLARCSHCQGFFSSPQAFVLPFILVVAPSEAKSICHLYICLRTSYPNWLCHFFSHPRSCNIISWKRIAKADIYGICGMLPRGKKNMYAKNRTTCAG